MTKRWKVYDIESEAGWGQRVDEVHYFDSYESAKEYVDRFNSHNTAKEVPSWYMYADGPHEA